MKQTAQRIAVATLLAAGVMQHANSPPDPR